MWFQLALFWSTICEATRLWQESQADRVLLSDLPPIPQWSQSSVIRDGDHHLIAKTLQAVRRPPE
jgi:hypothetical protein